VRTRSVMLSPPARRARSWRAWSALSRGGGRCADRAAGPPGGRPSPARASARAHSRPARRRCRPAFARSACGGGGVTAAGGGGTGMAAYLALAADQSDAIVCWASANGTAPAQTRSRRWLSRPFLTAAFPIPVRGCGHRLDRVGREHSAAEVLADVRDGGRVFGRANPRPRLRPARCPASAFGPASRCRPGHG
jgi:hypothetical protein